MIVFLLVGLVDEGEPRTYEQGCCGGPLNINALGTYMRWTQAFRSPWRNWLARPTVTGFGYREVDSSILSGDDFLAVVLWALRFSVAAQRNPLMRFNIMWNNASL